MRGRKEERNWAAILYFLGLGAFILALILPVSSLTRQLISILVTLLSGYHVVWEGIEDTVENTRRKKRFTPNTHVLMTLAAVGAIFLGEAIEAALLIFIFAGAHFLEEFVEGKSKREITKLLELNPREARRIKANGEIETVLVEQLKIGDRLQVLNGAQIATDGVIIEGRASIDESTINGESIPREKVVGDEVYGSTINGNSSFIMTVSKRSEDTVFSKILRLVEQAQTNLSPTASFIKKFEPIYVNTILVLFGLILISTPFLFQWTWFESFSRSLVFLVSSSPCALAVAAVPATLAGISTLARQGVLLKGGSFLSNFSKVKAVAFDKTGTLTEGKPKVVDFEFENDNAELREVIVAMERQSNHPLANAIVSAFDHQDNKLHLEVENQLGRGLVANYKGKQIQISKPDTFVEVGQKWQTSKEKLEREGKTVVFVGINQQVIGLIAIQDIPQATAISALQYLQKEVIETIMITGDAKLTGQAIGQKLGISSVVADVMPEQKAEIISEKKKQYGMIAMVGDGVNDAPALATADIGIAMGEGTAVAIETADMVLMKNDLSNLSSAHRTSKRLKKVVMENIFFALLVVLALVYFSLWRNMSIVMSVSLHEGSTLIVLLNSLRLLLPTKQKLENKWAPKSKIIF